MSRRLGSADYHYYRLCYSIGASLLDSKLNRDLISMLPILFCT